MQYQRLPRLLDELAMARIDGKYARLLARIAKLRLLILDDWAMAKLTVEQRRDLMEVIEDRYQRASTILATQVPIDRWHDMIGDPTYADAIMDRLVPQRLSPRAARRVHAPAHRDKGSACRRKAQIK